MKFTEAQLEKAFAELLGQEGFPHHLGLTMSRKPDEVLIEEDLRSFLFNQYAAQGITANEDNSILFYFNSNRFPLLIYTKATRPFCECFQTASF